jgi:hypothetical protein
MSTRSRIGIQLSDESVLSVYHHWDGYPEWLGRILKTHYNTREKVAELIDGGDMSSCWTDTPFDYDGKASKYGPNYYSLRGDDCPPRLDANKYDYLADGEEYAYLYTLKGEWVCYDRHQFEENTMPTVAEIPSGALAV